MFSLREVGQDSGIVLVIGDTYPLDIAMDHALAMKVYQSLSSVHQLEDFQLSQNQGKQS